MQFSAVDPPEEIMRLIEQYTNRINVPEEKGTNSRKISIWAAIIGILVIGGLSTGIYFLAGEGIDTTAQVRDIFIMNGVRQKAMQVIMLLMRG